MTTELKLFINDTSGKVHIIEQRTDTLCGTLTQGPSSIHPFNPNGGNNFKPHNWCTKCLIDVVMRIITNGDSRFEPVLSYAMSKSPKKVKKTEEDKSHNALRAELTFNDEEMEIALIAGVTVGNRDTLRVLVKKKITLDWERLDHIRDLTEDAKYVEMAFHSNSSDEV